MYFEIIFVVNYFLMVVIIGYYLSYIFVFLYRFFYEMMFCVKNNWCVYDMLK